MLNKKEAMKNLKWIDITKGIGILLVIFGHLHITNIFRQIIFTFHIPLFFFIGGFLFNYNKYKKDTQLFIKNKLIRLVFPYFVTNIIILVTYYLLSFKLNLNIYPIINLIGIFYGNGAPLNPSTKFTNTINIPSWFLLSLFCGYILLFIIAYYHEKKGTAFSCIICLFFITIGFNLSKYVYLPWGFDIALVSMVFMYPGYILNYHISIQKILNLYGIKILFILIFSFIIVLNGNVDMNIRNYNNLLLFSVGGLLGTYLTIELSKVINRNENTLSRFLIYIGKNSLLILLFYDFTPMIFLNIFDAFFNVKTIIYNSVILYGLNMLLFSIVTIIIIKRMPILKNIY
ncbi:MAG: acyltransferase family protein [Candidatus Methanoperedens sp.]|nr:acyltransferase family protein [Candidatus Methanoperedens sp.]